MGYIQKGKEEGATVLLGGERHGTEGYFIQVWQFKHFAMEQVTYQRHA